MENETKWNKKIDLSPKKETIAENVVIQEGFEEVDEMVNKMKCLQNKKKGFTKLPFLESIYDSITREVSIPETIDETIPETIDEPIPETIPETIDEDIIEGMTTEPNNKYSKFLRYTSNFTYNVSFDIFAYIIFQISIGKQPNLPGTIPNSASAKKEYDTNKKLYEDKKRVAEMFNRIITSSIGIFIAYNLYFSFATSSTSTSTANTKALFERINEWINNLPTIAFPLKCAVSPVNIFIRFMSIVSKLLGSIPYQPLLFGISLFISYWFIQYGIARYFIDMGMSVLDPLTRYVSGKKSKKTNVKKYAEDNIIMILIVFGFVVMSVIQICVDFRNTLPATEIIALLLWFIIFGLCLMLLPIGKLTISLIVFYVCMGSMTQSDENGMDIFKTMDDIEKKLIDKQVYRCGDGNLSQLILEIINNLIVNVIVKNLYLVTLIPISVYNIIQSLSLSSEITRTISISSFSLLIVTLLSGNETVTWFFLKFMNSIKYD